MSIISGFLQWQRKLYYEGTHILLSQWCQDSSVEMSNGYLLNQIIGNNPLPVPTVSKSMQNLIVNYRARCNELLTQILSERSDYVYDKNDYIASLIHKVHVYKKEGYSADNDLMNVVYSTKEKNVLVAHCPSGDNIETVLNINDLEMYAGKKGYFESDRYAYFYTDSTFPYKFKVNKIIGNIDPGASICFEFKSNCSVGQRVYSPNEFFKKTIPLNTVELNKYIEILTIYRVIYNFVKITIEGQSNHLVLDISFNWDGFEIKTPYKGTIK